MTEGRRLELTWSEHEGRRCLRVRGWSEAELVELGGLAPAKLREKLAVLPSKLVQAGATLDAVQPTAGRFETDRDSVCFVPRFPFPDAVSYSLLVTSPPHGERGDGLEVWTIQGRVPEGTPTTGVGAIYPSAEELPVNQLKLYVHFSRPMSEGWATRAVHVRRADNDEPIHDVFLQMGQMGPELWDRERRRLTLLLDPARIKRGLVPNLEAGYPLVEGVPIIFAVEAEFRDATGLPMRAGAERRYEIGPPLRARVSSEAWRYHHPARGTRDPLIVEFDRPMDHALLQHSFQVSDAAGVALAGRDSVGQGESSWQFEPQSPWGEGRHRLIVNPRLEDLAGNSLIRVFDRDLTRPEDTPIDVGMEHAVIVFECAPPSGPRRTKLAS